jgi:thiamine-phosphate pyrophosphorylase
MESAKQSRKVFVLTSNHKVPNETEILTKLFEEGMDYLHIRKFGWPTRKVEDLILSIPEQYHRRIVLNSHHNLCRPLQLGGIHISRDEKANKILIGIKAHFLRKAMPEAIIATSCHRIGKIEKSSDFYTYFFLSNLFGSISKQGVHQYKDKDKLLEFLRATDKYVIALGGIDLINIQDVKDIGFKAVAFHGSLWGFDKPLEKFCKLRDIFLS